MKIFNLLLAFSLFSLYVSATQRTVNNNNNLPGTPGQYIDIDSALKYSNAGDTILVAGSPINYATAGISITKKVVLIGPGYAPDKQNPLTAVIQGGITFGTNNASGSVIMGFIITGNIDFPSGTIISNVTIRRNEIDDYIFFVDSTVNTLIAENSFKAGFLYMETSFNQNNLVITNNIFQATYAIYFDETMPTNAVPITIEHNLFINGDKLISSGWNTFITGGPVYNLIINNNIFYNVSPTITTGYTLDNSTYDNNISYSGGTMPAMPPTNNVGTGNINNTDPEFTAVFDSTVSVAYHLDNFRLQAGSPASKTGTDGTDIGPTGGLYPIYLSTNRYLTGEPTIPEVKTAIFTPTSAVAPGGTLQIQTTATKIN